MVEAKRHLLYTDLAINEIAFVLGYADQFQFSKAFKRQTGLAPQLFREEKMTSAD